MNTENFLAFKRGPHHPRDGRSGTVELEVGVQYDTALEIDQLNGWLEIGETDSETVHALISVAARGLNELILFCFQGHTLDKRGRGMRIALRRFVAVAWLLNSNELRDEDGNPLSLESLSKMPQVKCTRCALSLLAQEFGKRWGFRARVQKRDSTKPNYAKSAKTGWEKRRARQRAENKS